MSKTLKYSCIECKFKCNEKCQLNLHLWKNHNICLFIEKDGSDDEDNITKNSNNNYTYYDSNDDTIKQLYIK